MVFSLQRIWLETEEGRYSLLEKCQYSESFWSVFFRIRTEYGEILRISPYSVWMRENTGQNNSEYGYFLRSDFCLSITNFQAG